MRPLIPWLVGAVTLLVVALFVLPDPFEAPRGHLSNHESLELEPAESPGVDGLPTRDSSPARTPGSTAIFQYEAGDRLAYGFHRTHVTNLTPRASTSDVPSGSALSLESVSEGIVEWRVYEVTEGGSALMGAVGRDVRLTIAQNQRWSDVPVSLEEEVLLRTSPRGAIDTIVFAPDSPVMTRHLWRDLLSSWQVVGPEDHARTTWQTLEADPTGMCRFDYEQDGSTFFKVRDRYESLTSAGKTLSTRDARTSGVSEFQRDGRLAGDIVGEGRLEIPVAGERRLEAGWTFEFHLESARHDASLVHAAADARLRLETRPQESLAGGEPIAGEPMEPPTEHDLAQLLTRLRGLVRARTAKDPEVIRLMAHLAELMRRSPLAVELASAELSAAAGRDPFSNVVIGVLGAAGTPAAQDVLHEVMASSDWPTPRRLAALFAFARVESPTPDIDGTLRELAESTDPCASPALLLLGAVADKVRHSDPARRQEIRDYLGGVIGDDQVHPDSLRDAVTAFGNLAPETLPESWPQLYATADDRLRERAIRALEQADDAETSRFLAHAAVHDTRAEVRDRALELLVRRRHEERIPALAEVVFHGPSPELRRRALVRLVEDLEVEPSIREVVAWVADSDPTAELRSFAERVRADLER